MPKIAAVFAHPDDEAFGPGGTLAKLARTNDIYLICCTDGDPGHSGLSNIRSQELLASAALLDIKNVIFLDFQDGSLCNNIYFQLETAIKEKLDEIKPELLITFAHDGVSGHIDHITVSSVVNHLFEKLNYVTKLMLYTMRDVERSQISDYFVYMPPGRIKSEVHEVVTVEDVWNQTKSAILAHKSQQKDIDTMLAILDHLPKEEYFLVRSK